MPHQENNLPGVEQEHEDEGKRNWENIEEWLDLGERFYLNSASRPGEKPRGQTSEKFLEKAKAFSDCLDSIARLRQEGKNWREDPAVVEQVKRTLQGNYSEENQDTKDSVMAYHLKSQTLLLQSIEDSNFKIPLDKFATARKEKEALAKSE